MAATPEQNIRKLTRGREQLRDVEEALGQLTAGEWGRAYRPEMMAACATVHAARMSLLALDERLKTVSNSRDTPCVPPNSPEGRDDHLTMRPESDIIDNGEG